ncbi:MAG: hypothetical protein U0638_11955 [Phycisphaerales bacterium]
MTFEEIAHVFRLKSEIARLFQELHQLDARSSREFAESLLAAIGPLKSPADSGSRSSRSSIRPSYALVRDHFLENGNIPKTKPQLIAATGLSEGALHGALYSESRGELVFSKNPAGGKLKLVALKPEVYEAAKRGS